MADQEMTLEKINLWKVPELKDYLKKRGLPISKKTKEELKALAYGAHHFGIQVLPTAQEEREAKSLQYKALLKTEDGGLLPDPLHLVGWENEVNSMQLWPPIMQFDIAKYLLGGDDQDLAKRLMSDYKEGKAYSYFESKFLGDISYHPIAENSKFCFLRSDCRPSQKISAVTHQMWILCEKSTGKIESAYCSCFAGLGSTCNHIAAMLFKVEFAWKNGLTAASKTSRPCTWNCYGARTPIEPKRIKDMPIKKPHHSKSLTAKPINPKERQDFNPTVSSSSQESCPDLKSLVNALYPLSKNSAIFQYVEMDHPELIVYPPQKDFNVDHEIEIETSETVPPSILRLVHGCSSASDLIDNLPSFTTPQVEALEEATRGQGLSNEWILQRYGRITASNIHKVYTFCNSQQHKSLVKDPSNLIDLFCGENKDLSSIPAVKYGKMMEPEARREYSINNSFNPTVSSSSQESCPDLKSLVNALYPSSKNSAIFQYVEMDHPELIVYPPQKDFNVDHEIEIETSETVPPSILRLVHGCSSASDLIDNLPSFTTPQVEALEEATRGQGLSNEWILQRYGRITASNIHKVYTFCNSQQHKSLVKDPSNLIDLFCGENKDLSSIPAVKYGKMMEPEARREYSMYLNKLGHKNIKLCDSGLFVSQDYIYIGASPDALVSCECCGEGLLEIKCPFSIADQDPNITKVAYLVGEGSQRHLKRNHQYYSQVIVQMGVEGRQWCDFFTYTRNGYFVERIYFNLQRWNELHASACLFFKSHVAPHLVNQKKANVSEKLDHK